MKWEYLVEDEEVRAGIEGAITLQAALDCLGSEGWELVAAHRIDRADGDEFRLFLKRPVRE